MASTVRIGLIGCGFHGREYLSKALTTVEEAELVACADVTEGAAQRAVRDYGYARSYPDWNDMLSQEELDAVIVATPHNRLKDAAVAVARAGRNIFVEKPGGVNRAEALEVRDAAREAGVSVMVGYCVRYNRARTALKALIEKGAVGQIAHVCAGKGGGPLSDYGRWAAGHSGWLTDPQQGGGQLLFLGVHITDQVLWMVGSEPERVYGEIQWHPENGTDKSTGFTIRFKNGVIATIVCSQALGRPLDFVEVIGSAGRARADWFPDSLYVESDALPEYRVPTISRPDMPTIPPLYEAEMRAWVDSLLAKREPPIGIDAGIAVLSVIDAVRESGRTGLPVALD